MKLYNISNAEKFLNRVLGCRGRAYSVKADGEVQDLKEMARFLISTGMARQIGGFREFDITLEDNADAMMMLNYAAQMNCSGQIA